MAGHTSVPVLDDQVCAIIGDLRLPKSWRELVSGYLVSGDERKKESNERRRMEEKLRRIRVQYREGDIDRREYQQESALTKAALDAVYVDMAQGLMLGLKPNPEFLPLFNLGEPVTTGASELVTGEMEQSRRPY